MSFEKSEVDITMELISSRNEQYSLISAKQREILVHYFNDGMMSMTDTIKINKASKAADLSIQSVKVRLCYISFIELWVNRCLPK